MNIPLAMHIPDGFLDGRTLVTAGVLAGVGLAVSTYHVTRSLPRRKVPLLGLAGAFIFAAQMLNFPVAAGTSGHLIGGTLAAILLGPAAAVLVLACVLLIQCLVFADGGLLSYGANLLLMGVVDAFTGYCLYRLVSAGLAGVLGKRTAALAGTAFGAWAGTMVAAGVCAAMLVSSHAAPAKAAFPAMLGVHALIGLGEALLTTLILAAAWASRPDLSPFAAERPVRGFEMVTGPEAAADPQSAGQTEVQFVPPPVAGRPYLVFSTLGLLLALSLAIFVAPFASESPDGLEKVAETVGFEDRAVDNPLPAPLPDYGTDRISSPAVATAVAGAIGTLIVFGLSVGLARALSRREGEVVGGQPS